MIRRVLLVVSMLFGSVVCSSAQEPERFTSLLLGAPDPAHVRAGLLDFTVTAAAADSFDIARAWWLAGLSYHRGGRADSAITCWGHSVEALATDEPLDALIDALQERRGADDVTRARRLIQKRFVLSRYDPEPFEQPNTQGRLAWSLFLAGSADSAHKDFQRARRLLDKDNPMAWVWRRRIAVVAQAVGDDPRALEMCKDLAVRSWLQDRDVMMLLQDVLGGSAEHYAPLLRTELLHAAQEDQARIESLHARRIETTGIDGFPVSTVLFPTTARGRHAVIAVETDPGELAHYDSLASALGRAGWALAVMDARGSGRAVAPECPSPESWSGREEAMESAVAGDVRRAFIAVARAARLDSTEYVVMASRGAAGIAVQAAILDPHVKAAVLLSPMPPLVELGRVAARLKTRRLPTFIETAPGDIGSSAMGEQLYESLDPRTSRLADSEVAGTVPVLFHYDHAAAPRLINWLAERFPAKPAPRPAPPRPR